MAVEMPPYQHRKSRLAMPLYELQEIVSLVVPAEVVPYDACPVQLVVEATPPLAKQHYAVASFVVLCSSSVSSCSW